MWVAYCIHLDTDWIKINAKHAQHLLNTVSHNDQVHTPPLSSREEQVDVDSSFPPFLEVEFGDFTLTVDNIVSPKGTATNQHYISNNFAKK